MRASSSVVAGEGSSRLRKTAAKTSVQRASCDPSLARVKRLARVRPQVDDGLPEIDRGKRALHCVLTQLRERAKLVRELSLLFDLRALFAQSFLDLCRLLQMCGLELKLMHVTQPAKIRGQPTVKFICFVKLTRRLLPAGLLRASLPELFDEALFALPPSQPSTPVAQAIRQRRCTRPRSAKHARHQRRRGDAGRKTFRALRRDFSAREN